jgi:hypothetical protein
MARAPLLVAFGFLALAGCHREAPEDAPPAAGGAGIPMGAVGAVGASFDAPSARPEAPAPPKGKPSKPPVGLGPGDPLPPDPFEPPDDADPDPSPTPKPKGGKPGTKPHSPSETTL